MKKLALILAICLAVSMLPTAFAEDLISELVEPAPGEAVGDTGVPGLVAEGDADDWTVSDGAADDGEVLAAPEEQAVAAAEGDPLAAGTTEARPTAGTEATAETQPTAEAQQAADGTEQPAEPAPAPTPHVDSNGPQLASNEITLGVGEAFALAPALPDGRVEGLACASADAAVATVAEDGTVTAVAPGEAVVTVTAGDGSYAECFVHVKNAPDTVAFASKTFALGKGETTDALKVLVGSVEGEFAGAYKLTSSNAKIVRVEADGSLKGVKTGKATVTVTTYNGLTAKCKVTVAKAPSKVTAGVDKKTLGVGETGRAGFKLPKGTASQPHFASENEQVATVDPVTGEVLGVSPGKAKIVVSAFNGKKSRVTVTVAPAPQALSFDGEEIRLGVGMKLPASAQLDEGAAGEISYAVADSAVATCKSGTLKGVAKGETELVATTYNGLTASCKLVVVAAPKKVTLPYKTLSVGVKQKFQLEPSVGGSASTYTYSSSNKKYVTVSKDGVVKGVKTGSATVTIKTYNKKTFKLKVTVVKAPSKVTLKPTTLDLGVEEKAVIGYSFPKKTMGSVTFSSGDEAVATVDALTGEVTGVAPGQAVITAKTHNGKKAKCTVNVYGKPEWIEAAEGFMELSAGMTKALTFTLSPGSRSPLRFTSSNEQVATVNDDGELVGVGGGEALITVETNAEGVTCQISVRVWPAPTAISLPQATMDMNVGDTAKLEPAVDEGAVTQFTYSTSDEDVVSVSEDGTLLAESKGSATVTVKTHNGLKAKVKVTVSDPWYPEKVKLTNAPDIMKSGETLQLEWTVEPENAVADLEWSTTDKSVGYVDADGVLHTDSFGYAVISATSKRNSDIEIKFTLAVETDSVVLAIPARTTGVDGIAANLAMIDAIRVSAVNQIKSMEKGKVISEKDAKKRTSMVNNAFKDYAFPWKTPALQKYWKAENSENGAKDFKPDRVYYGIPYISGAGSNRQYNAAKAVSENRFTDSGEGYYLLNQDNLLKGKYCGNDCSCFVDAAIWGTSSSHSADRTAEIAVSSAYKTISSFKSMRTGDLICKGYAHVVMFLYYANADKTKIMIIENGGSEAGTNTVHCIVMDTSYYTSRGYKVRRLASLG